jgi:hypothetical protein
MTLWGSHCQFTGLSYHDVERPYGSLSFGMGITQVDSRGRGPLRVSW